MNTQKLKVGDLVEVIHYAAWMKGGSKLRVGTVVKKGVGGAVVKLGPNNAEVRFKKSGLGVHNSPAGGHRIVALLRAGK